MTVYEPPNNAARSVSVRALLEDPELGESMTMIAGGAGLDRLITHPRIQKSGLALVGHPHGIVPTRIQILGETEVSYVQSLSPADQLRAVQQLFALRLSLVVVTRGERPPQVVVAEAERTGTPLALAAARSSIAITAIHGVLDERLAPRARIHGVLVDVFEVGVLLLGKSGIGKSECALELVMRGHRIVADDVIECDFKPPGMVFGQPATLLRHHIEVRGLGILNIKDLYGVTAVRERKRIDLVVHLDSQHGETGTYDRLGIEDRHREILGVPVREVSVPVRPGRNMSSIIEIAARDELLRQAGHNPAREFIERVDAETAGAPTETPRVEAQLRSARPNESSAPPPVGPGGERKK